MFSTGQLIFGILFAIAFIGILIFSYRKDRKLHQKQYRNNVFVLIGFLAFVGVLLLAKWLFIK